MKGDPLNPRYTRAEAQGQSYDQRTYQTRPNDRNRSYAMRNNTRQNYQGNRSRENFRRL